MLMNWKQDESQKEKERDDEGDVAKEPIIQILSKKMERKKWEKEVKQ